MADENNKNVGTYDPDERDEALLEKWTTRFKKAERFRKPYQDKYLRMWKLYRAYRDKQNYAYHTRLMPPIGFEIVETVKPRLTAAKLTTRIFPSGKEDVGSEAIESWGSLINYNFEVVELNEKKADWVDAMLKYGNGYAQLYWQAGEDGGDPAMDILDNWLLYFDPASGTRLKDSMWEIKQSFKKKSILEKQEKERTDVEVDEETGEEKKSGNLYKNLEYIENEKIKDDPRAERYEIETLKMGQIDTGEREDDDTQTTVSNEKEEEKSVEIWECYDHETDEIITIMNRTVVARDEESPYKDINEGRMIVDLPCIRLPWSAYAMGIMEPVETIIHEIADSRNQAMDDIVYNLDPVRKIKKGANITSDDIRMEPGAIWELNNVDDVVIERGVGLDSSWMEKDAMLRREVQTSLALSEYVRGLPSSAQEPSSKVELLLQQTQIRFSQTVRQMEIAMEEVVNIFIQMNKEFLKKGKAYRLLGDEIDFKELTSDEKQVKVDARVEIEPKQEKTPEQRKKEMMELYGLFVGEDMPAEGATPEEVEKWKRTKREMKKMILEEYDRSQYEDVLLGEDEEVVEEEIEEEKPPEVPQAPIVEGEVRQPIPLLDPSAIIGANEKQGLFNKLLGK